MRIEFDPTVVRCSTMSKTSKRPKIKLPGVAEDRAITRAAESDPDAQPLTEAQLAAMVPMRTLRGPPKIGRNKTTGLDPLQPRGSRLLPLDRRRLAIPDGQRTEAIRLKRSQKYPLIGPLALASIAAALATIHSSPPAGGGVAKGRGGGCVLLTGDQEFKRVEDEITITWL